jgi:hypothetical protein
MSRIDMIRFAFVLPFAVAALMLAYGNGIHAAATMLVATGAVCWLTAGWLYLFED